jgi:membrane protein
MAIEGRGVDRERILRTLTFWVRPALALRAVNRFQRIAGFDRAVALASSALTALIPLAVVSGAVLTSLGVKDVADRIIDRYDLSGGGAEAVRDVFSPAGGTSTSVSVSGTLLLIIAVLSFTRAVQRLFEQTWELPPLSVRNTVNGLRWVAALGLFLVVSGWVHAEVGDGRLELAASLIMLPPTAVFLIWSGSVLSAKRIDWRDLLPFGVIASILMTLYSVGATVYVPHLFSSYATRYGAIGAVFAMISTLFCVTVVLVAGAALGREVSDELARVRRGERPPEDEVRREWDNVLAEARSRWAAAGKRLNRRRNRKDPQR